MSWYLWRFWRIAISSSRGGIIWDFDGRWRHVFGPVWVRTDGPELDVPVEHDDL
jgi:hypothetical protein